VVIFLAIIFIIGGAIVWASDYSGQKQAAAAAARIQQGINRLKSLADAGQMINNRVPGAYLFTLRDCSENCFYELGAVTAEGQAIALEKVFLGDVYIQSLRPASGVFSITLPAGESGLSSTAASLLVIGSPLSRRGFIASFDAAGQWQPADFKSFRQKLPEAYLPRLLAGNLAKIEIASTTSSGAPRSVGIYWQKDGSFSQLSVKLSQVGSKDQSALRSEVRSFDSQLATLCFDLPDSSPAVAYLATLEPQGTAGEGAGNISLRVFKEYDCQGDNLPEGVNKVEILEKEK
jgi:hypothetical protein